MKTQPRRKFLQQTALFTGAAPLAGPFIRSARAGEPGPDEKNCLGLIGSGNMGRGDLECFLDFPDVECVVIADLDEGMTAQGVEVCEKKGRKRPDTTKEFRRVLDRKDVDAVLIATPDHWHALPTVMACQAGKDIYVEKPLAKTIAEGRAMVTAAQNHKRIVQMGSQWTSCQHMLDAAAFVKSGKLGKVRLARAWANLDWMPKCAKQPDGKPPGNVDYDFWLGPAPQRPFNPNRSHFNFRWHWDYAGGLMTDWGVHLIDYALLGMDAKFPKSVVASGGKFAYPDGPQETPDTLAAVYEFDGYNMIWEHAQSISNGNYGKDHGMAYIGNNGTLVLT